MGKKTDNLQKQIDRITIDVELLIEEHDARKAHRERRARYGYVPPFTVQRRKLEDVKRAQLLMQERLGELDKQVNGSIERAVGIQYTDGRVDPVPAGCRVKLGKRGVASRAKANGEAIGLLWQEVNRNRDRAEDATRVRPYPFVNERLASLELFQRRVVRAGYAAGLVGGCALVGYLASFVVALCG